MKKVLGINNKNSPSDNLTNQNDTSNVSKNVLSFCRFIRIWILWFCCFSSYTFIVFEFLVLFVIIVCVFSMFVFRDWCFRVMIFLTLVVALFMFDIMFFLMFSRSRDFSCLSCFSVFCFFTRHFLCLLVIFLCFTIRVNK